MPELNEELASILQKRRTEEGVEHDHVQHGVCANLSCDCHGLIADLLVWHKKFSSRVPTRKEIVAILSRYHAYYKGSSSYLDSSLINDLFALFSAPMELMWCEHCKLADEKDRFVGGWGFLNGEGTDMSKWKICPICEAKRPVEKGAC